MSKLEFKPEDFHNVYLETAKKLNWPIRPEMDVPYEQLSDVGKALDIALADFCDAKLQEWLDAAPTSKLPKERIGRIINLPFLMSDIPEDATEAKLVLIEKLENQK